MIVEAYHKNGYTVTHEDVEEFQVNGLYCDLYFENETLSLNLNEYDTVDVREE